MNQTNRKRCTDVSFNEQTNKKSVQTYSLMNKQIKKGVHAHRLMNKQIKECTFTNLLNGSMLICSSICKARSGFFLFPKSKRMKLNDEV